MASFEGLAAWARDGRAAEAEVLEFLPRTRQPSASDSIIDRMPQPGGLRWQCMAHPLVEQLRFTRSEWRRALAKVPEADGLRHVGPMNSIGWIVAHLAWQEQRYFLTRLAGTTPVPELNDIAPFGGPQTTPSLASMRRAWRKVTTAADPHLDALDEAAMLRPLPGSPGRLAGNAIQRVTYHYWFHIGEILAIRQVLEHPDRPEFVGNIDGQAPYRSRG